MRTQILLIDDDKDEHDLFNGALETLGDNYTLLSAFGTDDSIKLLQTERPDLIFLDINMPAKNGFVCLQQIKEQVQLKDIPVQMYSTSTNEKDIQKALALGASGYLVKAGSFTELCKNLKKLLVQERKDNFPE